MISDVLSDAGESIRQYLDDGMYSNDPTLPRIKALVEQMEAVRIELDTVPSSALDKHDALVPLTVGDLRQQLAQVSDEAEVRVLTPMTRVDFAITTIVKSPAKIVLSCA